MLSEWQSEVHEGFANFLPATRRIGCQRSSRGRSHSVLTLGSIGDSRGINNTNVATSIGRIATWFASLIRMTGTYASIESRVENLFQ